MENLDTCKDGTVQLHHSLQRDDYAVILRRIEALIYGRADRALKDALGKAWAPEMPTFVDQERRTAQDVRNYIRAIKRHPLGVYRRAGNGDGGCYFMPPNIWDNLESRALRVVNQAYTAMAIQFSYMRHKPPT